MLEHVAALVSGWLAVALTLWGTVAQFRRAQRTGVEGVSLATWALFVLMGCFWIAYGIAQRSVIIILGSLVVLPLQLAIVARLRPWRSLRVLTRVGAFAFLLCIAPTFFWGWPGGVYGTGLAMIGNRAPQISELVRTREASGVSVSMWLLNVLGAGLWVGYYVVQRLDAALVATCFAGLASLVIALLAAWRHAQQRATAQVLGVGIALE